MDGAGRILAAVLATVAILGLLAFARGIPNRGEPVPPPESSATSLVVG